MLLVRYVEIRLAVQEEFMDVALEVPDPVAHPGVLHRADQTLLAPQAPPVVVPGEDAEVVVAGGHGRPEVHAVSHPGEPVDGAEDETFRDGDHRPRSRAAVPHQA